MSLVFSFSCSGPKHEKISSVLYVFVMLVKQQEQNIEFIVVSPIPRTQMDLSK